MKLRSIDTAEEQAKYDMYFMLTTKGGAGSESRTRGGVGGGVQTAEKKSWTWALDGRLAFTPSSSPHQYSSLPFVAPLSAPDIRHSSSPHHLQEQRFQQATATRIQPALPLAGIFRCDVPPGLSLHRSAALCALATPGQLPAGPRGPCDAALWHEAPLISCQRRPKSLGFGSGNQHILCLSMAAVMEAAGMRRRSVAGHGASILCT
jgi:hypothetical protein